MSCGSPPSGISGGIDTGEIDTLAELTGEDANERIPEKIYRTEKAVYEN